MAKSQSSLFRELLGKLLVEVSDEKITLIDKTKIKLVLDFFPNNEEIIINDFIDFINNGCKLGICGNYKIDTDVTPKLPCAGEKIYSHQKEGILLLNPKLVSLHRFNNQRGGKPQNGINLLKRNFFKMHVMNACILDHLLIHQFLIPYLFPDALNVKRIFFWGTIFGNYPDDLKVRYLELRGRVWEDSFSWLNHALNSEDVAAVFNK